MKIVIAVVASSKYLSGVSRHAANMVRCLLLRSDVTVLHLIVASWQYESLREAVPNDDARLQIHQVGIARGVISRNLWYYTQLPVMAAQLDADIVHLAYPVPLRSGAFECPVIVTLHDLYPYDIPANFGYPKVIFNRLLLRQCLHAVDAIACVSESTLRRLEIYAPTLARQKTRIIFNCVEGGSRIAVDPSLPVLDGVPFLLCVAQHRRNKNILLAIQLFQRLMIDAELGPGTKLVVVGIEGPETMRLHRFVRESGLERDVVFLQGLDDAALQWCYAHCELLLAPSTIEGFGLPVVEAMLHHCRIVCSDIPAFREVGGSYCHYAEPSEDAFVEATRTALKSLRLRGAATDRFSAERISADYLRLYRELQTQASVTGDKRHYRPVPSLERKL